MAAVLTGHLAQMVTVVTVIVGSFEEEEEGIGIASDVFKVQGEDPANPGSHGNKVRWHVGDPFCWYALLGPTLRKPLDRNDFLISV